MTQLRKQRFMLWDFDRNEPHSNDLYDSEKGCKSAVGHILKYRPTMNIGIMDVEISSSGRALKRVDGTWIEVKGVAKLLYV